MPTKKNKYVIRDFGYNTQEEAEPECWGPTLSFYRRGGSGSPRTSFFSLGDLMHETNVEFVQKLAEKGGYLDADTWIRCAEEVLRKIKGKYRAPEITCACGEQTTNPGFYNKCLGALLYAASGGTIDETPQGTK